MVNGTTSLPLVGTNITAERLAAAQWSTGLLTKAYTSYSGCESLFFVTMMDLGMNFRVAPEIYNITTSFDISINNMTESLLASNASGYGLANPQNMYDGYMAG